MTPFDELVLEKALPTVKAWERLNDPEYASRLTMGEFYDLCIAAGYSEKDAQRVASDRGYARLQAGMTM